MSTLQKNIALWAKRRYWLVAGLVLALSAVIGRLLVPLWDTAEPVAWLVGLAVNGLILLKGLQVISEAAHMEKRSFEVTLGLRQGYSPDAPVYDGREVVAAIKAWMDQRTSLGLPKLQGKYAFGEGSGLIYPMRNVAEATEQAVDEPLFVFAGELSPKYDSKRSDDEVRLTLRDLALTLGRRFEQKRMYYSYKGVQYAEDVA